MRQQPRKLSFGEFTAIYQRVPRVSVDLLATNDRGVLLTKRRIAPGKGMWHIPGGTVLRGESLNNAIVRVAHEELTVSVQMQSLEGVVEFLPPSPHAHAVSLVCRVEILRKSPHTTRHTESFGWFKKAPRPMIKEHYDFLLRKGLLV